MDYSRTERIVRERIAELKRIKDQLYSIEERVVAIENEICSIDEALPSDDDIDYMLPDESRRQVMQLVELNDEAYSIIDDILGAPEDEMTGEQRGVVFSPEARGVNSISLEDALAKFNPGGKNSAS